MSDRNEPHEHSFVLQQGATCRCGAGAAHRAAPLDCRDGHDERMTMDFDGEPIRCIRCKAPSEGAAPRAEGLDVERLARAIYAADLVEPVTFSVQTVDSEAERIATEYARLFRPSDERVPESEEPR